MTGDSGCGAPPQGQAEHELHCPDRLGASGEPLASGTRAPGNRRSIGSAVLRRASSYFTVREAAEAALPRIKTASVKFGNTHRAWLCMELAPSSTASGTVATKSRNFV